MFFLHRGLQYFCLTCVSWLFLSEENVSELISEKEASLRVQVVQNRGGGGGGSVRNLVPGELEIVPD